MAFCDCGRQILLSDLVDVNMNYAAVLRPPKHHSSRRIYVLFATLFSIVCSRYGWLSRVVAFDIAHCNIISEVQIDWRFIRAQEEKAMIEVLEVLITMSYSDNIVICVYPSIQVSMHPCLYLSCFPSCCSCRGYPQSSCSSVDHSIPSYTSVHGRIYK